MYTIEIGVSCITPLPCSAIVSSRFDPVQSLGPAAGVAMIVVVAKEDDVTLKELRRLPGDAKVVLRGCTIEEFSTPEGKEALQDANVLLNCIGKYWSPWLELHLCA